MITMKKIGVGVKAVEEVLENASILGLNVIELRWNTTRDSIAEINGFRFPVIGNSDEDTLKGKINVDWKDGNVKFYPDAKNFCWGYIYDTPENRELLLDSFENDWFTIVDANIRETLFKEAEEKGKNLEPAPQIEVGIKKSTREKALESNVKNLERKYREALDRVNALNTELEEAKGEKVVLTEKRLKNVKINNREQVLEELKNAN